MVQLVSVVVLSEHSMPPPGSKGSVAELPLMVQFVTVAVLR